MNGGPIGYRESCVPCALAALLGEDPADLASLLWTAGVARPLTTLADGTGAAASASGWGTLISLALDALRHHRGIRVQRWNPDGTLSMDATEFEVFARGVAHDRAASIVPLARPGAEPPNVREPQIIRVLPDDAPPGPPAPLLRVRDWRSRFPFGSWLVSVPAGDAHAHALAVRDGEIVAGGHEFDFDPVREAFRLLPGPHNPEIDP